MIMLINFIPWFVQPCRAFIPATLLLLLVFSPVSQAVTYCVDATGTGAVECDMVVSTIAGIDTQPVVAGDRVLLKRGE